MNLHLNLPVFLWNVEFTCCLVDVLLPGSCPRPALCAEGPRHRCDRCSVLAAVCDWGIDAAVLLAPPKSTLRVYLRDFVRSHRPSLGDELVHELLSLYRRPRATLRSIVDEKRAARSIETHCWQPFLRPRRHHTKWTRREERLLRELPSSDDEALEGLMERLQRRKTAMKAKKKRLARSQKDLRDEEEEGEEGEEEEDQEVATLTQLFGELLHGAPDAIDCGEVKESDAKLHAENWKEGDRVHVKDPVTQEWFAATVTFVEPILTVQYESTRRESRIRVRQALRENRLEHIGEKGQGIKSPPRGALQANGIKTDGSALSSMAKVWLSPSKAEDGKEREESDPLGQYWKVGDRVRLKDKTDQEWFPATVSFVWSQEPLLTVRYDSGRHQERIDVRKAFEEKRIERIGVQRRSPEECSSDDDTGPSEHKDSEADSVEHLIPAATAARASQWTFGDKVRLKDAKLGWVSATVLIVAKLEPLLKVRYESGCEKSDEWIHVARMTKEERIERVIRPVKSTGTGVKTSPETPEDSEDGATLVPRSPQRESLEWEVGDKVRFLSKRTAKWQSCTVKKVGTGGFFVKLRFNDSLKSDRWIDVLKMMRAQCLKRV